MNLDLTGIAFAVLAGIIISAVYALFAVLSSLLRRRIEGGTAGRQAAEVEHTRPKVLLELGVLALCLALVLVAASGISGWGGEPLARDDDSLARRAAQEDGFVKGVRRGLETSYGHPEPNVGASITHALETIDYERVPGNQNTFVQTTTIDIRVVPTSPPGSPCTVRVEMGMHEPGEELTKSVSAIDRLGGSELEMQPFSTPVQDEVVAKSAVTHFKIDFIASETAHFYRIAYRHEPKDLPAFDEDRYPSWSLNPRDFGHQDSLEEYDVRVRTPFVFDRNVSCFRLDFSGEHLVLVNGGADSSTLPPEIVQFDWTSDSSGFDIKIREIDQRAFILRFHAPRLHANGSS